MIYAISDLHLSFTRNRPMDIFGCGWRNHVQRLQENWRAAVKADDLVIVPGDISWALRADEARADLLWLDELPGTKLIIKGNHDYWWSTMSQALKVMPPGIHALSGDVFLWDRVAIVGLRGWPCPGDLGFNPDRDFSIYRRESERLERLLRKAIKLKPEGIIVAMHYPPFNYRKESSGFTRLMASAGVRLCLYGHLHDRALKYVYDGPLDGVRYFCVSADKLEFSPAPCSLSPELDPCGHTFVL